MYLFRVRSLLLVTFAAAVVAAGCGDGALSSPTAPSALPESSAPGIDLPSDDLASMTGEFAALGGRGQEGGSSNSGGGKGKDKEKQDKDKSDRGRSGEGSSNVDEDGEDHHGRRRNLSGFVTAVGADSITIRGIIVRITPSTVIRHGHRRLTVAQITVGDHAQARGLMSADGTTMAATEIKVEDTGRDNGDQEAKVAGTVAGLSGTCPALTFTVGTTTVQTNNSTTFKDVTCATLANGATVEVKGMRQADGSILATEVKLRPEEVAGTVSELSGTCPSVTFKLGTTVVKTSGATTFEDGTCAGISNGAKLEVKGVKQTDGSILASEVELDLDELEGTIAELTGTCPSLTFTIGTTTVTTSGSTTFAGVACTALANGARVELKGTVSGTTFAATKVELDD
jgi:hypothetical protein